MRAKCDPTEAETLYKVFPDTLLYANLCRCHTEALGLLFINTADLFFGGRRWERLDRVHFFQKWAVFLSHRGRDVTHAMTCCWLVSQCGLWAQRPLTFIVIVRTFDL